MDSSGRMLIRGRVMLTDMHDGRKKVWMDLPGIIWI